MCFSAEASFVAGGVLLAGGIDAVRHSDRPSTLPLACVPLLFSIQQLTEGLVWLGLEGHALGGWFEPAVRLYMTLATIAWPVLIPLVILLAEPEVIRSRVRIRQSFLIVGASVALYHVYCLLSYPLSASIIDCHISYSMAVPLVGRVIGVVLYLAATVIPCLLSRLITLRLIGGLLFLAFLVPFFVYHETVISTWCFFAALISLGVCHAVRNLKSTVADPSNPDKSLKKDFGVAG